MPSDKDLFKYFGVAGKDLPRFDPSQEIPPRAAIVPRLSANIGLSTIPAKLLPPDQPFGIIGVAGIVFKLQSSLVMPANLSRCRPDKFSDEYFVERRLNGFNPGQMKLVKGAQWQYAIRYDCRRYKPEPAGILPAIIEARFTLQNCQLQVHSIEYNLNQKTIVNKPGDTDWEWAKKLFRSAEFVFQESQSHLARTHLNVEQYAMAYYRNILDNPIKQLWEPHLEGLLNIDKLGASIIFGNTGIIPQASALDASQIESLLKEEVSKLNYHGWHPRQHTMPDAVTNNYFDPAALAAWQAIETYVANFFQEQGAAIQTLWPEIEAMSQDIVDHSILDPQRGTLAIASIGDLQKLSTYIIYHSTFLHSWVNYKQYEDGGDPEYAALGLWDSKDPAYPTLNVTQKHIQQTIIAWTLSHVRYNPIMENGPPALRDLLWQQRAAISPGIPMELLMNSIHI